MLSFSVHLMHTIMFVVFWVNILLMFSTREETPKVEFYFPIFKWAEKKLFYYFTILKKGVAFEEYLNYIDIL